MIKPKGTAGAVKIHADCGHNLKASTELRLFDKVIFERGKEGSNNKCLSGNNFSIISCSLE